MNILAEANLDIKKNRPSAPDDMLYTLWIQKGFVHLCFKSRGCANDAAGSCVMCDYGVGRNLDTEELVSAFQCALSEAQATSTEPITSLLLGTYGSLLDTREISTAALLRLLEEVAACPIDTIIIETHYQTINKDVLHMISKTLEKKHVTLEFGFESVSPLIQRNCYNKEIDLSALKEAIHLTHEYGFQVTLNILFGAPFLTTREQIEESKDSVEWAFRNGADSVVLFPMNIKPFTLLHRLVDCGLYKPVSHWSFIDLLNDIPLDFLGKVYLSWYGNREIHYPHQTVRTILPTSCDTCHPILMEFYEKFGDADCTTAKKELLDDVISKSFSCHCRRDSITMQQENPPASMEERIKKAHEYIRKQFHIICGQPS